MATDPTRLPAAPLLLAAVVVTGAFVVFPFGSDAEYVVFDPVWYAAGAERGSVDSILAHHPLFHLALTGLAQGADAMGVGRPGHVAARLMSGLGAAWVLLLLAGLSGRNRWRVGAGLGLFLLMGRTFFFEAFTGENVLPAIAAGLAALVAAMDERQSWLRVGLWTYLALLLRQDNVLLIPAIVLALSWRSERPAGVRTASWLAAVGGFTLISYLGIWGGLRMAGGEQGWFQWLWGVAKDDYSTVANPVLAHLGSFGIAVIGKQWAAVEPWKHACVGLGALTLVAACGAFFRGSGRWERFAFLAAMTALLRFVFYAWFEPTNTEWVLFTFVLAAAVAAQAARGTPATRSSVRIAAGLLLSVTACATWSAHGEDTLSLRSRRFEPAARWIKDNTRDGWAHFGFQNRSVLAVQMQGVECGPLWTEFEKAREHLKEVAAQDRKPMLVLVDVAVQTGMPYDMRQLERRWRGLQPADPPLARVLWERDGVYVVGFLVPQ